MVESQKKRNLECVVGENVRDRPTSAENWKRIARYILTCKHYTMADGKSDDGYIEFSIALPSLHHTNFFRGPPPLIIPDL